MQGCVNFQLVPRLFTKNDRFGVYFKISTCSYNRTVYAKQNQTDIYNKKYNNLMYQKESKEQ